MYSFIPLLALLPATYGAAATTWWKPTLSDTFLYDADRIPVEVPTVKTNTKISLNKSVYIVDMEGHTAKQIADYKTAGKRVVCYISAGTWEPWRQDHLKFSPACYCGKGIDFDEDTGYCKDTPTTSNRMNDPDSEEQWDEWWLDIKTPSCLDNIQPIMRARIQAAKDKGCDAVDPDNMDVYANTVPRSGGARVTPYGVDEISQVNYLKWWANEAHTKGMAIGLKNAGNLLKENGIDGKYQSDLVANFDFNVIEACKQYKECDIYDSMLKANKPQIRVEYYSNTTKCPTKQKGVTFSVYKNGNLNTKDINLDCPF